MATLSQLVMKNLQTPVRRCWIKRRLVVDATTYESNWIRVDFFRGKTRVIDWGSFSLEIDFQPGQIGKFDISELQMTFDNEDGHWNVETDAQSIFYPDSTYLNRKLTKLKIEAGYIDESRNEVGVATVFEGVIDKVQIGEDQAARVTILPYTSILNKYPITDLSFSATPTTVSDIIDAIMNQVKITTYIPFVASVPASDITVQDPSALEGTYWDVIKDLAQNSNSIPLLVGSTWSFVSRTIGVSSVWDFKGTGTSNPNINRVTNFDDEGADRVRVFWRAKGTSIEVRSSNQLLLKKYLSEPQEADLNKYSDADKAAALTSLLGTWEINRPTIQFSTRFMVNILKPLDQISIRIFGQLYPIGHVAYWDLGVAWDNGALWGSVHGAINITDSAPWMVTRVVKDLQGWNSVISAEKQL